MMRLLWAKALDEHRTAIVIDSGMGELVGGVVILTDLTMHHIYGFRNLSTLELKFYWEWSRVVKSPEDFAESKEWECRKLEPPMKLIKHGENR